MPVSSVQSSWLTQDYRWNEAASRYIAENGRFVPRAIVDVALEQTIAGSQNEMVLLSERLQNGSLSVAEWRSAMGQQVKLLHTAEAALARGGWAQMTPSDWGWVGSQVKKQYQFLDKFAGQIASGKQPLNGRFFQRVRMYAAAGRGTFEEMRRRYMRIHKGAAEERRLLGIAEHCDDCVEYADRSWQPVGTLPAIGQSQCLTHCKCHFEFRDANGNAIGG